MAFKGLRECSFQVLLRAVVVVHSFETVSSASKRVAAHIITRLLITENSVCIQDNFEGQCLLSDMMNHHRTGRRRRRLRTEWLFDGLVSPWYFFVEALLLLLYFVLVVNVQMHAFVHAFDEVIPVSVLW